MLFAPPPELNLLMVCTANVCRSPMAEAMLRARLRARGLHRRVAVRSAGTRVAQPGRKPDPRVERLMQEKGVPMPRIRARQLDAAMLARTDWVLVMVGGHAADVRSMLAGAEPTFRLRRLGSYRPGIGREGVVSDELIDIPDPYYGSWVDILRAFDHIDASLDGVMRAVQVFLQQERPVRGR